MFKLSKEQIIKTIKVFFIMLFSVVITAFIITICREKVTEIINIDGNTKKSETTNENIDNIQNKGYEEPINNREELELLSKEQKEFIENNKADFSTLEYVLINSDLYGAFNPEYNINYNINYNSEQNGYIEVYEYSAYDYESFGKYRNLEFIVKKEKDLKVPYELRLTFEMDENFKEYTKTLTNVSTALGDLYNSINIKQELSCGNSSIEFNNNGIICIASETTTERADNVLILSFDVRIKNFVNNVKETKNIEEAGVEMEIKDVFKQIDFDYTYNNLVQTIKNTINKQDTSIYVYSIYQNNTLNSKEQTIEFSIDNVGILRARNLNGLDYCIDIESSKSLNSINVVKNIAKSFFGEEIDDIKLTSKDGVSTWNNKVLSVRISNNFISVSNYMGEYDVTYKEYLHNSNSEEETSEEITDKEIIEIVEQTEVTEHDEMEMVEGTKAPEAFTYEEGTNEIITEESGTEEESSIKESSIVEESIETIIEEDLTKGIKVELIEEAPVIEEKAVELSVPVSDEIRH